MGALFLEANAAGVLDPVPQWLDILLTAFAWVWLVNLYNFMDGIDGISGVETGAIGLGFAGLAALNLAPAALLPLGLAMTAAAIGFLVWNWSPARIFLGDVGGVPLGYLAGFMVVSVASVEPIGSGAWVAAMILPAYYVADATITLCRRSPPRISSRPSPALLSAGRHSRSRACHGERGRLAGKHRASGVGVAPGTVRPLKCRPCRHDRRRTDRLDAILARRTYRNRILRDLMRIVVTGANGFVGRATCRAIISAGHALVPVSRTGMEPLGVADHQAVPVGEVSAETDWLAALDGADAVVHLVNPFLGGPDTPELRALGERVTVGGSVSLAHQAAKAGVRQLVFVSTLKVCGERSDAPLRPEDPPSPASAYGAIKKAAEVGNTALRDRNAPNHHPATGGLRAGNRGTIHLLAAAIRQRPWIALPFGGARANARAMIFVDNLAAAFVAAATDAAAEDRVFHVKDRPASRPPSCSGSCERCSATHQVSCRCRRPS